MISIYGAIGMRRMLTDTCLVPRSQYFVVVNRFRATCSGRRLGYVTVINIP